ncbi:MAG: hypothetical protein U0165_12700 [Polyangiaceae bacterium]
MNDSQMHHEASAPGGARDESPSDARLSAHLRLLLTRSALSLAVIAPLGMALWQSSQATQWRDDAPLVRGMTLALSPGDGAITSLLIAVSSLLPVGSVVTRGSMVPAMAVACLAWLMFHAVLDALEPFGRRWYFPLVAMSATLTACLSSPIQREATIAGGATVGAALVLASWDLARRAAHAPSATAGWALGALVGAAASESLLGGVIALVIAAGTVVWFQRRDKRLLASAAFGLLTVAALVLGVTWVRPMAPGLGGLLSGGSLQGALVHLDVSALHARPIEGWLRDLGVVGSVLAVLGLVACYRGASLRPVVLTAAALVVIDVLSPSALASAFTSEPWALVRVVATCAVGVPAAVGVIFVGRFLVSTRAPFARPAAILVGVFHAALVFVAAEDSSIRVDRSAIRAAGLWTTEAVEHLPMNAMTLVRTEPLAWRMLAAQVAQGLRPDLVIVPQPMLTRAGLAVGLLRAEPALAQMLRELATSGQPSEYSLSTLADARPLYVELDPRGIASWSPHDR